MLAWPSIGPEHGGRRERGKPDQRGCIPAARSWHGLHGAGDDTGDPERRPVQGVVVKVRVERRRSPAPVPEQPSDGGQPHAVHDTLGDVERVEIDTAHFKGNYPDRVSLEGADFVAEKLISAGSTRLRTLLVESKLEMDKQHGFVEQINDVGRISHVRMSIYPDGGISRLRLFGRAETETRIVMITLRPRHFP